MPSWLKSSSMASSSIVLPVFGSTCLWYPAWEALTGESASDSFMNWSLSSANFCEAPLLACFALIGIERMRAHRPVRIAVVCDIANEYTILARLRNVIGRIGMNSSETAAGACPIVSRVPEFPARFDRRPVLQLRHPCTRNTPESCSRDYWSYSWLWERACSRLPTGTER